jgi:hypothetical protein
LGRADREPAARRKGELDWIWGEQTIHQQVGGRAMQVCSQPWVTAKIRAAAREAKALSKRNTRL